MSQTWLLLLLAKATLVLGLTFSVAALLQKRSAGLRHVVWLSGLASVLVLPLLMLWAPLRLPLAPGVWPAQLAVTPVSSPPRPVGVSHSPNRAEDNPAPGADMGTAPPISLGPTPDRVVNSAAEGPGVGLLPVDLLPGLILLWVLVAVVLLIRLIVGMIVVRRIVRRADSSTSPELQAALYEIADRLGLEHTPRLLISDEIRMPFASGILAATIVLPRTSQEWTAEQLTGVLIHELAHIRRRDILGHSLGWIACAVYWFHPLVWMAARRLRNASERACDDLALELGVVPSNFAEHLLDLVSRVRSGSTPALAMALAHRREFEGRMLAILDPTVERRRPMRKQLMGLACTLVLLSLAVAVTTPVRLAEAASIQSSELGDAGLVEPDATPMQISISELSRARQTAMPGMPGPRAGTGSGDTVPLRRQARMTKRAFDDSVDALVQQMQAAVLAEVTNSLTQADSSTRKNVTRKLSPGDLEQNLALAGESLGASIANEVLGAIFGRPDGDRQMVGASRFPFNRRASNPDSLVALLQKNADPSARRAAAWGLEGDNQPAAIAALSKALAKDTDAAVRKMAAWSLSSSRRSDAAVTALGSALRDSDSGVREMAAWALGVIGSDRSVAALSKLLEQEPADSVQVAAAWALGQIHPRVAPASLNRLLGSDDSEVVEAAAWAIGVIGDSASARAVVDALLKQQRRDAFDALVRTARILEVTSDSLNRRRLQASGNTDLQELTDRNGAGRRRVESRPWPWPRPIPLPWDSED